MLSNNIKLIMILELHADGLLHKLNVSNHSSEIEQKYTPHSHHSLLQKFSGPTFNSVVSLLPTSEQHSSTRNLRRLPKLQPTS